MLQRCRENEAACLLAAVLIDGCAKCNYSRYIGYTSIQLIVAVRNDDRIIDVCLTILIVAKRLDGSRCHLAALR